MKIKKSFLCELLIVTLCGLLSYLLYINFLNDQARKIVSGSEQSEVQINE